MPRALGLVLSLCGIITIGLADEGASDSIRSILHVVGAVCVGSGLVLALTALVRRVRLRGPGVSAAMDGVRRWAEVGERRSGHPRDAWGQTGGTRLLRVLARLVLGQFGDVKLEEWSADLAEVEAGWERTVYLLDLIFDLPRLARAARKQTR
jgi:hypothetical protein